MAGFVERLRREEGEREREVSEGAKGLYRLHCVGRKKAPMAKLATQRNISSMTPLRTRRFGASFGVSVTPNGLFGPRAAPTMRTKLAHEN